MSLLHATEFSWVFEYLGNLITIDRSKYQTLHEAQSQARKETMD